MVACTCNYGSQISETGGLLQVQGHPGMYREYQVKQTCRDRGGVRGRGQGKERSKREGRARDRVSHTK